MARRAGSFLKVGQVIDLFVQMGCDIRTAEGTIKTPEGDVFNVRYLVNPETGGFQPLVDLDNDEAISRWEIESWERRLGVIIPKPE